MTINARQWRKSSLSSNGENCVEVTADGGCILIRDSKYLRDPGADPARQPIISVAVADWPAFLDLAVGTPATAATLTIARGADGGATIQAPDGTRLDYTPAEWSAFIAGVLAGEFDLPQTVAA